MPRPLYLVEVFALGVTMAVLLGMELLSLVRPVTLYALAVGVALIVLALRLQELRRHERRRVACTLE